MAVDHKPLLKVFGERSPEEIPNTRLKNIKEKTLRYSFSIVYVPWAIHKAADAISQHPTGLVKAESLKLPDDIATVCTERASESCDESIQCYINALFHSLKAITWQNVQTATVNDTTLR